jgi:uncharacterized protein YndB with AHSA1/START domain
LIELSNAPDGDEMADIRHSVQIPAAPEAIYPLISTADGFSRWWSEDVTESNGAVELGFFNRTTIYRLRLQIDEPGTRAEWLCDTGDEWSGTRIVFRLEPIKSGTLLRFTHADWRAESEYFLSCNTTWGELMYRLKAVARATAPGPLFLKNDMAF